MNLDAPARRNVELKANDPNPKVTLAAVLALGAEDHGTIVQRDTYFEASETRLKLREESPGRPHLIQYARTDEAQERPSSYRIVEVDRETGLVEALTKALGVTQVVNKSRRLFLWGSVRIHLDLVEDLGSFIELEAVVPEDSDLTREYAEVAHLRQVLSIKDEHLCATGYAAQLARADSASSS